MKSKPNSAFNAAVHHLNIDQPYPSGELIDENFIRSDKDNSFLSSDSYNSSSNFLLSGQPPQLIESDLINVNKTIKLINNSQLLKCLNRTMLNDETSSSPLDEQLSQTSNASSANAELSAAAANSKGYRLELVPISSPGDQSGQQQQLAINYYPDYSVESPENNSSGEWNNGAQQDLDYEPHPKQRRIQARQSTQLAGQYPKELSGSNNSGSAQSLADQFSGQLSPLQQLVLAQQQLNALRGQQQQQSSAAALTSQLVSQLSTQLTKDSSDPDAMSANAVALSSLLNGSMNFSQLSQHLNQLNQLSQLGLSGSSSLNSSSLTSLLHNMVSNQSSNQQPSPSVVSQSNQPSSAFNISLNRNSSSPNLVLSSSLTSNATNSALPFLVANNGSAAVSASNQPTNSVSSQSLDSSKKPFDICIVCGDKASGGFSLFPFSCANEVFFVLFCFVKIESIAINDGPVSFFSLPLSQDATITQFPARAAKVSLSEASESS